MNTAIIAVGSNINPEFYVAKAREMIRENHVLIAESNFVCTKPVGFRDQDDFLNGVFKIETMMTQRKLNSWLKMTEKKLERKRTENRYGPRTIDLDIVVWNDLIIDDDVFKRSFLQNAIYEVDSNILI